MARLFSETQGDLRVLDAGVGSLTAAFGERIYAETGGPRSVEFVCYEIDAVLSEYLTDTLRHPFRMRIIRSQDNRENDCRG